MKIAAEIFTFLLVALLLSGCGSVDAPVELSKTGSLNVIVASDAKCQLFSGSSMVHEWKGPKVIDGLEVGRYKIFMVSDRTGARYEEIFEISSLSTKVIEIGTCALTISTEDNLEVTLFSGDTEINRWSGSKQFDSLWVGSYAVTIKESGGTEWSESFVLVKDQQKTIEVRLSSIQITTNISSASSELLLKGTLVRGLTGSGTFSNLLPGSYKLQVNATGFNAHLENIILKSGETKLINATIYSKLIEMITIEGGTFTMGCTWAESTCFGDEIPSHQVSLSSYEIGKYEVTQKLWKEVMGTNPSYFIGDNKPVERVSWYDIIDFCNKASNKYGLTPVYTINGTMVSADWSANGYRLPTEAEWEYAARQRNDGVNYNYLYSGIFEIAALGWYAGNSGGTTHDVGTKIANRLEIFDMSGNVWEACWDWYGGYNTLNQSDPKGPVSGTHRVLRGGSYLLEDKHCRVAKREFASPENKGNSRGFRLARTK